MSASDGPTLFGMDVSHWQTKTPDLKAAGASFLIARATIGTTEDTMYDKHIAAAKAAGIVTGAYHFNWDTISVAAQVEAFLNKAGRVGLYVIDIEGANAFNESQGRDFIKRVQATGRKIGLYHSDSGFPYWGQDWNWVASYSYEPTRTMAMWQYGPYHGIDANLFFGGPADLRDLTGDTMAQLPITDQTPKLVTTKPNSTWYDLDGTVLSTGHSALPERLSPYGVGNKRAIFGGSGIVLVVPATVKPLPTGPAADCSVQEAALAEALTRAAGEPGRIQAAIDADRLKARVGVVYP